MPNKSADDEILTPKRHAEHIAAYAAELPAYQAYAAAMRRVLEQACRQALPSAIVQSRHKSLRSFAEKCARKWSKYKNPAQELTDLCGARVIVHSLENVHAVRAFIEANFCVIERDDKTEALGTDVFGYRDLHFLVRLDPARCESVGFTREERELIGARVAEVQVRTIVQHAWADILHDRMYKTPLPLSPEAKRTGALLAAIMEDGDRSFDRIANELDGMAMNYTAYATREEVEHECAVLELLLEASLDPHDRAPSAVALARLLAPLGEYARVVSLLDDLVGKPGPGAGELHSVPNEWEIGLELGYALCKLHRPRPSSLEYRRGVDLLDQAADHYGSPDLGAVPELRKQRGLRARAFTRSAWAWQVLDGSQAKSRLRYSQALEAEPENPYYLANQIAFELFCAPGSSIAESMRTQINGAIKLCREHAISNTEMPFACFTAGRLHLLIRDGNAALAWYARGIRHLFEKRSGVGFTVLGDELEWIDRLHHGRPAPPECDWSARLLRLALAFNETPMSAPAVRPVLIIAGGAASMTAETLNESRPVLREMLGAFSGVVVSGGTRCGIPGCVGEITEELRAGGRKTFDLVGYIPVRRRLPADAPLDERYDRFVEIEERFSPSQILRMWEDFQQDGITPGAVLVAGFGGGPMTAVEFAVALALGASTAAMRGTGGVSRSIVEDKLWSGTPTLLDLPLDVATARAFVTTPPVSVDSTAVDGMAQSLHARYVQQATHRLPSNLKPWNELQDTYKQASRAQAAYAVEILRAAGFTVRPRSGRSDSIQSFDAPEFGDAVEKMAELEHGRWNVERTRAGWRSGPRRIDADRVHNFIVPWHELPSEIQDLDRSSVRAFPKILADSGLEIARIHAAPPTA